MRYNVKNGTIHHFGETLELYYQNKEMIEKLKRSEEEIDNKEGIDSDVAFKELRHKYGY